MVLSSCRTSESSHCQCLCTESRPTLELSVQAGQSMPTLELQTGVLTDEAADIQPAASCDNMA